MQEETSKIQLSVFAKVQAALSAGHPLPHALLWAEVLPKQWSAAEPEWKTRLVESAAGDCSLLVAYDAHVLRAADLLAPELEPIESDITAWTQFSRHFAAAVDPNVFLAACGLQMVDVLRLQRVWADKRMADSSLADKALEAMRAPLDPVPALRIEPRLLQKEAPSVAPPPEPAEPPRVPVTPLPVPIKMQKSPEIVYAPPPAEEPPLLSEPDLGSTLLNLPISPFVAESLRKNSLPFTPNAPSTVLPPVEKKKRAPDFGQTIEFQAVTIPEEALRAALPFQRGAGDAPANTKPTPPPFAAPVQTGPVNLATFTLERYASLCVELNVNPGQEQAVISRYGLTQEQWTKVNAYWQGRMAREPDVRTAWEKAFVTYREWLLRR